MKNSKESLNNAFSNVKFITTIIACFLILAIKSCIITYKTESSIKIEKLPKNDSTKIGDNGNKKPQEE